MDASLQRRAAKDICIKAGKRTLLNASEKDSVGTPSVCSVCLQRLSEEASDGMQGAELTADTTWPPMHFFHWSHFEAM